MLVRGQVDKFSRRDAAILALGANARHQGLLFILVSKKYAFCDLLHKVGGPLSTPHPRIYPQTECTHFNPLHLPRPAPDLFRASLLPMLPKHTQLQNKTLMTQMPVSIVLFVARPPSIRTSLPVCPVEFRSRYGDEEPIGAGMISGSSPRETIVPARPTAADRRKPVLDRSIRYHKSGFAIAKVRETCIVEAHGTFLCEVVSLLYCIFGEGGRGV